MEYDSDDWDPSLETVPVPIPASQLAAMSLDERGPQQRRATANSPPSNIREWFTGGTRGNGVTVEDRPSASGQARKNVGMDNPLEPEDDKAYVTKYKKETEKKVIEVQNFICKVEFYDGV